MRLTFAAQNAPRNDAFAWAQDRHLPAQKSGHVSVAAFENQFWLKLSLNL